MTFDLGLVIPAYNEERRLPAALERLSAFADASGLAISLVVSDDGSRDATAQVVTDWAASRTRPNFAVRLVQIRHRGKGAAVRAGMAFATAPIVGYCDADMSAGEDAIAKVYDRVKAGADLAIASRALPESVLEVRQPWYREMGGRTINLFLRKLSRIPYRDTQCGLKMFRSSAALEIFRHQRLDGFAFDAELVVLADRLGFLVEEVPIRWAHAEGSKLSIVKDTFRLTRDILRIVRRLSKPTTRMHAPGIPTSEAIDRMALSEETHWWHQAKRSVVSGVLSGMGMAGPCLDLGCGGGAMLSEAAARFPLAVGIDLSPQALDHARRRGLSTLVRASADDLPFRDESFGTVLALDVIEHHPTPERLLAEAHRALRPAGSLIVTVPAYRWMWSYADHLLGHYRRYTKPELRSDLEAAGFQVARITHFHAWLLPLAWMFRTLRSVLGKTDSSDDFPLPKFLNWGLWRVACAEKGILARRNLPFGLSLLAVCRREASGPRGDDDHGNRPATKGQLRGA